MRYFILLVMIVLGLHGAEKTLPISYEAYHLAAMDAQHRQKYDLASSYYEYLYTHTHIKEYLYESLRMDELSTNTQKLTTKLTKALLEYPNDAMLNRFHIIELLKEQKYSQASSEALTLCSITKEARDYELYAQTQLKLNNFQLARDALYKSYKISFAHDVAERIALIDYTQLDRKKEATAFLEEHIGTHGNSLVAGRRLAGFYADNSEFDKAGAMYEETYDLSPDPVVAQETIRVYLYQKNTPKLIKFLEKSGVNDDMLLEVYAREKEFSKASELAEKMYEKDANPRHLAQSSVFTYENAKDKKDPKMIAEVIDGLTKATADFKDPLYLNYLGYMMIENDLNITQGIKYVNEALAKQPDSPYYIDSLAWGYYKLGECAQALKLIKQVESMMGSDEQEVKDHLKAIEKCKTKEKN
jgi:hypothetical protein